MCRHRRRRDEGHKIKESPVGAWCAGNTIGRRSSPPIPLSSGWPRQVDCVKGHRFGVSGLSGLWDITRPDGAAGVGNIRESSSGVAGSLRRSGRRPGACDVTGHDQRRRRESSVYPRPPPIERVRRNALAHAPPSHRPGMNRTTPMARKPLIVVGTARSGEARSGRPLIAARSAPDPSPGARDSVPERRHSSRASSCLSADPSWSPR